MNTDPEHISFENLKCYYPSKTAEDKKRKEGREEGRKGGGGGGVQTRGSGQVSIEPALLPSTEHGCITPQNIRFQK